MRKLNGQIPGQTDPAPSPSNPPDQQGAATTGQTATDPGKVVIDPGARARAAATSGGQIEVQLDADGNPIQPIAEELTINVEAGSSPWLAVLSRISPDLEEPAWQSRHGAALAIQELARAIGGSVPSAYIMDVARDLLALLVLDRFGDFLGDTVVAPVRETAAQALGILLKHLEVPAVLEIHAALMAMIRQPWARRGKDTDGSHKWEKFSWEIRHAGLLGMKYMVAVRPDLLGAVKGEKDDVKPDVSLEMGTAGRSSFMRDIVDVACLA